MTETSPRRDLLIAALLFALALWVYLRTLCPTIYWGDCADLASDAYTLGIAHPTGYPVWVMLAHLWIKLIPFHSIIWRLNALSAIFGALAVVSLYGFARTVTLPQPIAFVVAGLFAFSPTLWQQCLFCETYSLSAFYTCTLLFLAGRWRARGCRDGDLRMLAVCYGLTMTNHQVNTLFMPGFIAFILWTDPTLRNLREKAIRTRWIKAISIGLLPLLSYLYIPIRASMHPIMNWGDPETWDAFVFHVTGRQYAYGMFTMDFHTVMMNLLTWVKGLGPELSWVIVLLAVIGLILLWGRRGDRPLAFLLSWIVLADVGYAINYSIYNRYIYYIPSYIVLSTAAGYAVWASWQRFAPAFTTERRTVFATLGTACLLALLPFQLLGHWEKIDLSRNWACYDYGHNLLSGLPANTLLIANGNDTAYMSMMYLQILEHNRRDVVLVSRGLLSPWNKNQLTMHGIWHYRDLCRRYPDFARLSPDHTLTLTDVNDENPLRDLIENGVRAGRSVAVIEPASSPWLVDWPRQKMSLLTYLNKHYQTAQIGLPVYVYAKGKMPSWPVLLAEDKRVWQGYSTRGVYDGLYLSDEFLTPIGLDYATGNLVRARIGVKVGDYADAAESYQNVLRLFQDPEAQSGLVLCQAHLAQQKSANLQQSAHSEKPVKIADELILNKQP